MLSLTGQDIQLQRTYWRKLLSTTVNFRLQNGLRTDKKCFKAFALKFILCSAHNTVTSYLPCVTTCIQGHVQPGMQMTQDLCR